MFHFKQFSLSDNNTAMKVGTDAVLLGSWVDIGNSGSILDIGTGSGILALMMAQRSDATVDAVEIDAGAVAQARENVAISPWSERIFIHELSFQHFVSIEKRTFDLIISNPPFFCNSLKPPDPGRYISRHNDQLPVSELIKGTAKILSESGRAAFILPSEARKAWIKEASSAGLFPIRCCSIIAREGKPSGRLMIEFCRNVGSKNREQELFIRDKEGNYSTQYKKLTSDFYLGL